MTKAELGSYDRDHMAHKAKDIYYLALYRRSLPSPDLKFCSHEGRLKLLYIDRAEQV